MELRDLEYFAVVAEYGNVRRASEALGLSPPALSKSLRRLEKAVNAKLVTRTPRGVDLTAVGTALADQARRVRVTLGDVIREASDLCRGEAGQLRIGSGPTVSAELPAALLPLLTNSPKLSFQVITSDNDATLPLLLAGKLDLVFNYTDFVPGAVHELLTREFIYEDVHVVCASRRHPLTRRKTVRLSDLANERWALNEPQVLNTQRLSQTFQDHGLPLPVVALSTRSLELRIESCAAAGLLTYLSTRILNRAKSRFALVAIGVRELEWRRPVGVFYRRDAYLSPAARRFIDIAKRTFPAIK